MHEQGMVIGYDYEQQPRFVFEGHIERGLRSSGAIYKADRKDGVLTGWCIPIVVSALQPNHVDSGCIRMRRANEPRLPFRFSCS